MLHRRFGRFARQELTAACLCQGTRNRPRTPSSDGSARRWAARKAWGTSSDAAASACASWWTDRWGAASDRTVSPLIGAGWCLGPAGGPLAPTGAAPPPVAAVSAALCLRRSGAAPPASRRWPTRDDRLHHSRFPGLPVPLLTADTNGATLLSNPPWMEKPHGTSGSFLWRSMSSNLTITHSLPGYPPAHLRPAGWLTGIAIAHQLIEPFAVLGRIPSHIFLAFRPKRFYCLLLTSNGAVPNYSPSLPDLWHFLSHAPSISPRRTRSNDVVRYYKLLL